MFDCRLKILRFAGILVLSLIGGIKCVSTPRELGTMTAIPTRSPAATLEAKTIRLVQLPDLDIDGYSQFKSVSEECANCIFIMRCLDDAYGYLQTQNSKGEYVRKTVRYAPRELMLRDSNGKVYSRVEPKYFDTKTGKYETEVGFKFEFTKKPSAKGFQECSAIDTRTTNAALCAHVVVLDAKAGSAHYKGTECTTEK